MATEDQLREYLRRATNDLRMTRRRLREIEEQQKEPIAIVATGCRFPGGVQSPEDLWRLVADGVDAIGEFPDNRGWNLDELYSSDPDARGTSYSLRGGFVSDADMFDAEFFGISPREALAMDPQQRVLLEVAWETIENAGMDAGSLRNTPTATFIGTSDHDYSNLVLNAETDVEGYIGTGTLSSLISGRLSFVFGFDGPAVTIDTACSSSLVAIHLACQSLRRGESTMALAGGVTVMATATPFVEFSRQRGLAPDGRCKAYANAADGTGFSEGVGLVMLERLSEAVRARHRVLGVIRGSAVNQDGASNGLTAPNGPAQMRVIGAALRAAGLSAGDVDVVEGHGTGTRLGDPIEAEALLGTYGRDRSAQRPLWLGSVKSNIGHTQAAAGVAGVIKMMQAMRHGVIPATLHVDEPTQHVRWADGAVRLLDEAREWPEGVRRAGISSFGISGTNVHMIVEQAPEQQPAPQQYQVSRQPAAEPAADGSPDAVLSWILSARTGRALQELAGRLRRWLSDGPGADASPGEVASALLRSRTLFEHRAAVVGTDRRGLMEGLETIAAGLPATPHGQNGAVVWGSVPMGVRAVWVFPGQGWQWVGMAASLYGVDDAFTSRLDDCAAVLDPLTGWSLIDLVTSTDAAPEDGFGGGRVEIVQPAMWAAMVSLAAMWTAAGVEPAAVVGHSQGEIAAACVAGVLSLADAARVVVTRANLIREVATGGAMATVSLPPAQVAAELAANGRVGVAADNGPALTVISGPVDDLQAVVDSYEEKGVHSRLIPVDYASHSPLMQPLQRPLTGALAGITHHPARFPMFSTVTGAWLDPGEMTPAYWYDNLRYPVRFTEAITALATDAPTVFIEISAHPVLTTSINETIEDLPGVAIPTLHREHATLLDWHTALAAAHTQGVPPPRAEATGAEIQLPNYPFQRERYWLATASASRPEDYGLYPVEHALLTAGHRLPDGSWVFTGRLDTAHPAWASDHMVLTTTVLPGTALLDLALAAGAHAGHPYLRELTLQQPLVMPAESIHLHLTLGPASGDSRTLTIHTRTGDEWTQHAMAVLSTTHAQVTERSARPPRAATALDVQNLYPDLAERGYLYGPAFTNLRQAHHHGNTLYAVTALPADIPASGHGVHPALLDAALHVLALRPGQRSDELMLPFSWAGVTLHPTSEPPTELHVRIDTVGTNSGGLTVALHASTAQGQPVLTAESVTLRAADPHQLISAPPNATEGLLTLEWAPVELGESDTRNVSDTSNVTVIEAAAPDGADPISATSALTGRVLHDIQQWLATDRTIDDRLIVVTRHAVVVNPDDSVHPAAAAVWGLVRSAQSEHPDSIQLVDTDTEFHQDQAGDRPQTAIRGGTAYIPHLAHAVTEQTLLPPADVANWRLEAVPGAGIEGIRLAQSEAEAPLRPGEVRVAVRCAGLNFRDVLVAMGMVPLHVIGGEQSGLIVEVGPGVEAFSVGDRICGLFTSGGVSPVSVTDSRLLMHVPADWSYTDAATVPVAFLTAFIGLHDFGRVKAGDRVLIHAATGGVGMAAVQLARAAGAEVYATASPGKWSVLHAMGLDEDHIASSRTLDFESKFAAAGMDVVLNCLAGEFTDASLRLVSDGGRFIEIGKTDIRDAGQLRTRYPRIGHYHAVDVVQVAPQRLAEILAELHDGFTAGVLRPLPARAYPVSDTHSALQLMAQARHTGKVTLTLPAPLDTGTVVITGGTGTLGSLLARHLVTRHGVGHLLLLSRSGPDTPHAAALRAQLTALGANVAIRAADCANPDDLAAALEAVDPDHPLTGVIHAAGTLDDHPMTNLTLANLDAVLPAKVDAAWHLHRLTAHLPLAAFVMFSSAAATFGTPGQGNYAAANAFLDALAYERRRHSLPATSLGWGFWQEASGLTAHLTGRDKSRMTQAGITALTTPHALALFDNALRLDGAHLVLTPLNPHAPRPHHLLARLIVNRPAGTGAASQDSVQHYAATHNVELTQHRVLQLVLQHTATILGHSDPATVGPHRAFKDLGFESLTAVELRNHLAHATGLRLPPTLIYDQPTPAALAAHLTGQLVNEVAAGTDVATMAADGDEPIAIVAMACHYPGEVHTPDQLWDLVHTGTDAIGGFPVNRGWNLAELYHPDPNNPGTTYTRHGGFLSNADQFDNTFFNINPREALAIDPQQRLLLHTAWETLENAAIDPTTLRGSATGIFAGVLASNYGTQLMRQAPDELQGYLSTGMSNSVASGRIAYFLGLQGPAVTIDTACSSSLVAIHLAAQALRQGECTLALAGGVTVMAEPTPFVEFGRQQGLAPDGRCKAFAADADGTGFSEGVGMLLLERLSDAHRNGHPIRAIIRGSAINQDGASNGLTAPNGLAQQRVITQALANAGLTPTDIDAVEAHGTGTTLGDPIEAQAILATYRQRPADQPLWLGSIKSNIGHTQAAAGAAGIIKMVQAIEHEHLPRTLHAEQPTPHVDWTSGNVNLLTEPTAWPTTGRPRRAGISSFGMSGTNAHIIIEQPPPPTPATPTEPSTPTTAWLLSAHTATALRAQARELLGFVRGHDELPAAQIARPLATGRAALPHRGAVVGDDRAELLTALAALAEDGVAPNLVRGVAEECPRPVFVFPGQGSQWAGMAVELLDHSPAFAERVAECATALDPVTGWSLMDVLRDEPGAPSLERVEVVQPVLFAVNVSLAAMWRAYGVEPAAVLGHSQGEIAAAFVAGALTLADAAQVVAVRSRIITRLAGRGGMVSVPLPADDVAADIAPYGDEVSVAAVNGPASTVVSGTVAALDDLIARYSGRGVEAKRIPVDFASHSTQVASLREDILSALADVTARTSDVPYFSTVNADWQDTAALDADYWYRNLRYRVQMEASVRALLEAGQRLFLEISPHPVLTAAIQDTLGEAGHAIATLRRGQGGQRQVTLAAADAHTHGVRVDWRALLPERRRHVALPNYAFEYQRFWLHGAGGGSATQLGLGAARHPLLGTATELADGSLLATGRIGLASHPWLADHAVVDTVLLPGTAFVDMVLWAADLAGVERVEEVELRAPLVVPPDGDLRLHVTVDAPAADGSRTVGVHSRPDSGREEPWTHHASATLTAGGAPAPQGIGAWPPPGADPLDVNELYDTLADRGYQYGPAFQGLRRAWRDGRTIFAEARLDDGAVTGFPIAPALLDSGLHALIVAGGVGEDGIAVPFAFSGITLHASGATELRIRLSQDAAGFRVDVADESGDPVATIEALTLRPLPTEQLARLTRTATAPGPGHSLWQVEWTPVPVPEQRTTGRWALLGGHDTQLAAALRTAGADVTAYPDLAAIGGSEPVPAVVVTVLPAGDQQSPAAATRRVVRHVLALLQTWIADERFSDSRLVLLAPDADDLAQQAVQGLIRSAQSENPDRFVLVNTAPAGYGLIPEALAAQEPQVAVRDGALFAPRLTTAAQATAASGPLAPHGVGTVLITGGTGTLGGQLARHLVTAHGVRSLLLLSRQGPDADGAGELRHALAELGAEATIRACDTSDLAALQAALASIPAEHPLVAVVHAAGVLADHPVTALTDEHVDTVLAAKVDAAWHLHLLTRELPLRAFVLFSSAAAVLATPGQGNYAAANAFLDALARRRLDEGLPARSLGWGYWAQGSGLTEHLTSTDRNRMASAGVRPLATEHGMALFDAALGGDVAHLVPLALDRQALASAPSLPPVLRGLVRQPRRRAQTSARSALQRYLTEHTQAEGRQHLLGLVQQQAAAVLGHAGPSTIDPRRAFKDVGFDSLTAVELRNHLAHTTGLRLPPTLIYDQPTPAALAAHLLGELTASGPSTLPRTRTAEPAAEPIAIVAMACHYPGEVHAPNQLWDLVTSTTDAIGTFPTDRGWNLAELYHPDPNHPGTTYTRHGGFLSNADQFDNTFFNINPREALATDPQQRLLLHTAWETLENAAIDPTTLRGSPTGIFAGIMNGDYGPHLLHHRHEEFEGHLLTGNSNSVASGRIAYFLGLEGPAVTIDTACSSSLVAIHLAAQALRQGECTLALAGGVTVMATPSTFIEFGRQQGLAPDGRCKAFAADADGTGFSEGVGMLLLERLSDATRNGHPILAVIRGSAVNQDGASNGLTAPNGLAQQRVITQALANAGLTPTDIDAVEAHGTGTTLGDPIEAQAILNTYGQRPPEQPLWLGSIKSNIGHTQAAAGAAGIIKMVQAIEHKHLPPTLHAQQPTPHVDWTNGNVNLLTKPTAWPTTNHPRRAGISSFGIGGTNAHIIIEQPPPSTTTTPTEPPPPPTTAWLLSAHTSPALRAQTRRLLDHVRSRTDLAAAEVAYALAAGRAALDHRAVVVGDDHEQLTRGLAALLEGETIPQAVTGSVPAEAGHTAFLFSGQGSQRAGMGRELYEAYPTFAAALDEACAHLDPHLSRPLREVMFGGDGDLIDQTEYAQPAIFAFQTALYRLVTHLGVKPDYLLGHSIGEITAMHVSGALSLADAALLVTTRGRLMQAIPGGGAMVAIRAAIEDVRPTLNGDRVSVAAHNAPDATVISGDADAVLALAELWRNRGHHIRRLNVSHAFHSAQMDPVVEPLRELSARLSVHPAQIPVVSNLTALPATVEQLASPDYWARQAREAVRYHDAVRFLREAGVDAYLELAPHPTLTPPTVSTVGDANTIVVPTARADVSESQALLIALARLHVAGRGPDWTAILTRTRAVPLPTYAFHSQRFWLSGAPARKAEADGSFWTAVELGDSQAVAEALDIQDEARRQMLRELLPALSTLRRRHDWWHRLAWEPVPLTEAGSLTAGALSGTWQIATPDPELGARFAEAMTRHGADVRITSGEILTLDGPSRWILTTGAVSLDPLTAPAHAAHADLWATQVAGAAPEHGLIDLPEVLNDRVLDRLVTLLAGVPVAAAIRDDRVFRRRLVPVPTPADGPGWRPSGPVLVTGGTEGLGAEVARWLARAGAARIILTAPGDAESGALLAELTGLGARVTVVADVAAAREAELQEAERFSAVFHTAGDAGPLQSTAAHLVLLSDGTTGGHHDVLAVQRHAAGLPATSLAWGPWSTGGEPPPGRVSPRPVLDGLSRLMADGPACLVAAELPVERGESAGPVDQVDGSVEPVDQLDGPVALTQRLLGRTPDEQAEILLHLVRAQTAAVAGLGSPDQVPVDDDLQDLGFTSLTAIELRNNLCRITGLTIPPGAIYDMPTPLALSNYLRQELSASMMPPADPGPAGTDHARTGPVIEPSPDQPTAT